MIDKRDTLFFLNEYTLILKKSISFFIVKIRKHIIALLLIVLIATAAGTAYWYSKTPYYESDLVCSYNNARFPRKIFGEMTQKINLLAQSGSRNELARLLNLPPQQTAKIISVEARNRSGSLLYEDITDDYQPLHFILKATDRAVFTPFEGALVNYLSATPYQKIIGMIEVGKITEKIGYLKSDMMKVDSITEAYTFAVRNGYAVNDSANHLNITELLNYKEQLEDRLTGQWHHKALESLPTVTIIHGFAPGDKPSRGSKKIIFGCAVIGFFAAMCWIILGDNKQETHA